MERYGRMARVFENGKSFVNMKQNYKLLIIGDIYDNHIVRYVTNLKKCNPNAVIDIISVKKECSYAQQIENAVNHIYWFKPDTTNLRLLRGIQRVHQFNCLLRRISKVCHYDIINVHYPQVEYRYSIKEFRKIAEYILLTPWGSDVYRVSKLGISILKVLYKSADYVCCTDNRFGYDVRCMFALQNKQLVNLDIGSETIDYIFEFKDIVSPQSARKNLSFRLRLSGPASPVPIAEARLYKKLFLAFF